MLNILIAERMKLKRNKLLLMCTLFAVVLPTFALPPYEGEAVNVIDWVFRLQMFFQLAIYPVLSGFIVTFLLQKEYADQTVINTLTAPVGRMKYLLGKLCVWLMWYLTVTVCFFGIICLRVNVYFGAEALSTHLPDIAVNIFRTGMLYYATMTPVAWIAVLQKKIFYPSLLATLAITAIGAAAWLARGVMGSVIPWLAVVMLLIPNSGVIAGAAYASIALCCAGGLALAAYAFKRQEL